MSKRTRPKDAMAHRRRLRRIRGHELRFQMWNFDPEYDLSANLYGFTPCPLARCRGLHRCNMVRDPWTVLCNDCGYREKLRPRVPIAFSPDGQTFRVVGA